MFCAIWLWGPAAGPIGVAAGRPRKENERSTSGSGAQNRAVGKSKIRDLVSHSWTIRPRRTSSGNGVRGAALVAGRLIAGSEAFGLVRPPWL